MYSFSNRQSSVKYGNPIKVQRTTKAYIQMSQYLHWGIYKLLNL